MSGSGTDNTDWAGLLDSASNGNGGGLNLTLQPGVLKAGAAACHVLLSDVLGYITAVQGITSLPTVLSKTKTGSVTFTSYQGVQESVSWNVTTTVGSLGALFGVFNRKTTELVTALRNHQRILTDMGDTFNAAAKAYQQVEVANGDLFTTPSSGSHIDLTQDTSGPVQGTDGYWGANPHFATAAGSGVTMDSAAASEVAPEPSSSWNDLPDFANIADIIDEHNGTVGILAGQWQSLATQWARSVTTFQNAVGPVFGGWGGSAASVAQSAVTSYGSAAQTMATSMTDMFNAIANTNEFLYFVWQHMPKWGEIEPLKEYMDVAGITAAPSGDKNWYWNVGGYTLNTVDTFWDSGDSSTSNQGYVNGMQALLKQIPSILDPNTADGASGNLSGDYNYNPSGNNSGSSGSTGNSGSSGSSGSSGNNSSSTGSGSGTSTGTGTDSGSGGGAGTSSTGTGTGTGSGGGGGAGTSSTGSGSGGSAGTSSTGTGTGSGSGGAGTSSTGSGTGSGTGAGAGTYGSTSSATGASGMDASNLLTLFGEALQLLTSGIPLLEQLGSQLAAGLGPGLQALATAVQNGAMTVKQALDDAAKHVRSELTQFEDQFTGPHELDLTLSPRAGVAAHWGPQGYTPDAEPNLTITTSNGPAAERRIQLDATGVQVQEEQ